MSDGSLAVFAPSPVLTITIEPGPARPTVHLHAGGQGFWVARLAAALGADVTLCCALGGETGRVLRSLIEAEPMTLRAALATGPNGCYVHDRRSGDRVEVVRVESATLDRHVVDELYGIALAAGLDADLTMITGCDPYDIVEADMYRRLVGDLRRNDKPVIADLTGPPLRAALQAGVDLLKLSDEELVAQGYAASERVDDVIGGACRLHDEGARTVVVSRAAAPALVLRGGDASDVVALVAPQFEAHDTHGTGDSMFAATGVGLARGRSTIDAVRLGMAAGSLNATRRGLGTGTRREIEQLAAHVQVDVPTA